MIKYWGGKLKGKNNICRHLNFDSSNFIYVAPCSDIFCHPSFEVKLDVNLFAQEAFVPRAW